MDRRRFAGVVAAGVSWLAGSAYAGQSQTDGDANATASVAAITERLQALEAKSGGRLGVSLLDTQTERGCAYRGDERFPMCSTAKLIITGLVLSRVDAGHERLQRRIRFAASDLVAYSPITEKHTGPRGMTVAELCQAALTVSDNTACNLLLKSFGGPSHLTAYVRSIGDRFSRLDRNEPTLNEARPGDPRDTTTPDAMLATMRKLVVGEALSQASRMQMQRWMIANQTGDRFLRAQLPVDWRAADKTGSGSYGTNNDIGVFWPPGRAPVLITCYLTATDASVAVREETLAQVGSLAKILIGQQ